MHSVVAFLRRPRVLPLLLSELVGRLGRAANTLAIIMLVDGTTASYAWVGAAAAVLTVTDAGSAPFKARLADRFGYPIVLLPLALVHGAALVALSLDLDGVGPMMVLAGLAGLSLPPLSGAVKALWAVLARTPEELATAYVLESSLQQVLYFAGPLYVAVAVLFWSPRIALAGLSVTTILGIAGFLVVARGLGDSTRPGRSRPRSVFGPLAVGAVAVLVLATTLHSVVFGAANVAMSALDSSVAGFVLACGPVGGLLGVVLTRRTATRFTSLFVFASAALIPLPLVFPFIPAVAMCLFLNGLLITSIASRTYVLVEQAAPVEFRTEAFTWLSTANAAGFAAGAALAGLAIESAGLGLAFALPAAATLTAALLTRTAMATSSETSDASWRGSGGI